jgi:hypothetical protein
MSNQIALGHRRPQRIKNSLTVTLPKLWRENFPNASFEEVDMFIDSENMDLIIKAPKTVQEEKE